MPAVERHYRLWLLILWCAGAAAAIAVNRDHIADFRFWDPDDVMRLLEVRDWLNGQSWFDVSQHRMNWPDGLAMHWSRWVDLPLAGLIVLFEPWVGQRAAETIAATAVPMATLGATMALVGGIARRLWGAAAGLLAAAFCLLSIGTWYAMLPMRIDHHGWQIVAGLAMVRALIARTDRKGAIMAGLCGAAWIHISLDGLILTSGAAVCLGLLWVADPVRHRFRLPIFLAMLAASETLFYLSTHRIAFDRDTLCDQISPLHILIFWLGAILTFGATLYSPNDWKRRVAAMVAAALACALLYRFGAPQCSAGPFAALGPLGRGLWYPAVPESAPLWHIGRDMALVWGVFPWVGLTGALVSCLRAGPDRTERATYAVLLTIAAVTGLLVTRTGALANLLAIPGAVSLIVGLVARTEGFTLPLRVLVRAIGILALSPVGSETTSLLVTQRLPAHPAPVANPKCGLIDQLRPLDRFAPTTIIAPLELGPIILAGTHHAAVTGPYHRAPAALEDVLGFFSTGNPRLIAARRHVGLLVLCPNEGELSAYVKIAPHGLAALLQAGRIPDWLHPVAIAGTSGLRIYRIAR
jgi:hypothetical protein